MLEAGLFEFKLTAIRHHLAPAPVSTVIKDKPGTLPVVRNNFENHPTIVAGTFQM